MLAIAYGIFVTNFIFGVLVQRRVIDSSNFRIVHHVLYFLVMGSVAGAAIVAAVQGQRGWYLVAIMGAALMAMPLLRGRSSDHWIYASFCMGLYSALVLWW